jgi:hypothetical protein
VFTERRILLCASQSTCSITPAHPILRTSAPLSCPSCLNQPATLLCHSPAPHSCSHPAIRPSPALSPLSPSLAPSSAVLASKAALPRPSKGVCQHI